MEQPVLSDKSQFPTDEVIFAHIGKMKPLWLQLFSTIHAEHPDFTEEWRYYNDGKSWLMKVQRKGKTVFWLRLEKGSFRTTFYFMRRSALAIARSSISDELKKQFTAGKTFGNMGFISIVYKRKRDVEEARKLIEVKLSQR